MLTNKAYKRMLTASVLTAVMGPGSVYAADVQAGYTPDMTTTTTTQTADVVDTAEKQAVYNATEGKVLDKKAQAEDNKNDDSIKIKSFIKVSFRMVKFIITKTILTQIQIYSKKYCL